MEPIEFLSSIWGEQKGWVFLPRRTPGSWEEGPAFAWPGDKPQVEKFLNSLPKNTDQYFCPNLFTKPSRRKEFVKNPHWLYADLDHVDPHKLPKAIRPTVAIQSSPGRFQSLWRTARPLEPDKHQAYNRRLTYAIGADKGGWDITQVLRVPGTRNWKYPSGVSVRLVWAQGEQGPTSLRTLNVYLRHVEGTRGTDGDVEVPDLILPADSSGDIRKALWSRADERLKALLSQQDSPPVGERSDRLWELECRLLEVGLTPEEVFVVVKDTVWNKFEDRRDADLYLWREIQKAHLHVGSHRPASDRRSGVDRRASTDPLENGPLRIRPRVISYSDLLTSRISEPEWLIEDWWTMGSHGVIAGLPKSYKSLVSLDMAISVASETPFMGQFAVNPRGSGPVLIIQQENSLPLLRDRLFKISHSRGLQVGEATVNASSDSVVLNFPPSLPILFYNDFGFDMTMPDDREAIEELIRSEGIKMVMFDPLYLMIGGADENQAKEMRPVLSWLLRLRNLYGCSVVVIHHWGKGSSDRKGRGAGGTKLLGSTTIYGWLEAALYLEAKVLPDSNIQVVAEREFRERLSPPPVALNLKMGNIGDNAYKWDKIGAVGNTNRVLEAISGSGDKGLTMGEIKEVTELGQKTIRDQVEDLLTRGLIKEATEGRGRRFFIA